MNDRPRLFLEVEPDQFALSAYGREQAKVALERAPRGAALTNVQQVLLAHVLNVWNTLVNYILEEGME